MAEPVILLRKEDDLWRAQVPALLPAWQSNPGNIATVVENARATIGNPASVDLRLALGSPQGVARNLKLKVAERTELTGDDVVALIEANRLPDGLDLSDCLLKAADLSWESMRLRLDEATDSDPDVIPWLSTLTGGVDLRGVRFQRADLSQTNLDRADLYTADLQYANLAYVKLSNAEPMWADFRNAHLWVTDLRGANLTGSQLERARLLRTDLRGTILANAKLQDVDLSTVQSLHGARWLGAFLNRTRLDRHQLGDEIGDEARAHKKKTPDTYHEASEAYLLLKNNFNSIGRYEDAAWAHIKEQQMEKMRCFHDWRSSLRKNWFSFLRWLRNWAFEALTGYGERAWMPVLWGLVIILAFAGGYAIAGNVSADFAGDPATATGSHNFVDALTHSIGAFATIGFNTLEPLGWGARLLTAIESAFGIGLFALFIFTLGNRMSRS